MRACLKRLTVLPRTVVVLSLALGSSLLLGCARDVPPRPVPQPEAKAELPPWYPEKPWTDRSTDRVYLEGKVVFDLARHSIRPQSEEVLQKLLEYLEANPDISRVRLEGHTCELATEEYNQALSVRRAISVADWLVDNGLDHMRLLAVAFGEQRPMYSNRSAAGRRENRRAEFHIAEVAGSPFRGEDPAAGGLILEVQSKQERERAKQPAKVPTAPEEKPVTPTGDEIGPIEEAKPQGDSGESEPGKPAEPEQKAAESL